MVHVHIRWSLFISFILYIRRAPLSPCTGYNPGEVAVQRMKRQVSSEVTTRVAQTVMNASRYRVETISNKGVS